MDGGYVFCRIAYAVDGGEAQYTQMCTPGTYFCLSALGCAQCLSDADCIDATLPTYDPSRSRCDLDSGVAGYQNFCQQCLVNADCASDPIDNRCDLNQSSLQRSIDLQGFETCANLGPGCPVGAQPALGGCASSTCASDDDCADAVSSPNQTLASLFGYSGQQAQPFCVSGACANSPDDSSLCPNCYCISDSTCRDPRAICDLLNDHCACTDSSQCGGPWPICELSDAGDVDDAGQLLGSCGCRSDQDCGDAGLRCLDLPPDNTLYGGPACLFDCSDPRFPGCSALSANTPLCDVSSGLCEPCESDQDCRTQAKGLFVGPLCRNDGICGCQVDTDCPNHEICGGSTSQGQADQLLGQCIVPPLRCTPGTCTSGEFCDLDGGLCESIVGARLCASNSDCAFIDFAYNEFCETDAGACVDCLVDSDCVAIGAAAGGYTRCLAGACSQLCAIDQDCAGNPAGSHCVTSAPIDAIDHCGCTADPDCVGNASGPRCEGDAGLCSCADAADCSPGQSCQVFGEAVSQCASFCQSDAACQAGFFCSEFETCLPRCDDGGGGCQAPFLACDSNDLVGANGIGLFAGPDPGAVWCYGCVTGDDCRPGLSCYTNTCSAVDCYGEDSCHTGEICGRGDLSCHASCDAGPCPAGQVCDPVDSFGNGLNLCYPCLSARDCPGGEGCSRASHTCGACQESADCPPDAICSNFWGTSRTGSGACLQNCDVFGCGNPSDVCAVLPSLTPDHRYCFGCLEDADCGDGGLRCDNSVGLTFKCE